MESHLRRIQAAHNLNLQMNTEQQPSKQKARHLISSSFNNDGQLYVWEMVTLVFAGPGLHIESDQSKEVC